MKVFELFAGVGGFRIGLENADKDFYKTVWSNQYEPSQIVQHAFDVYNYHYPDSTNINKDINDITDEEFKAMDADMIVGGFPCQDYSVAHPKMTEQGIEGDKGMLFWQIMRAVRNIKPKYLILENVDRLLKAPTKQRGRDFAMMLRAFDDAGYMVEWRMINAADWGHAQRRRRIYMFITRYETALGDALFDKKQAEVATSEGILAQAFPVDFDSIKNIKKYSLNIYHSINDIADNFTGNFFNCGAMSMGLVFTADVKPNKKYEPRTLRDIIQPSKDVDEKFYVNDKDKLAKFKYERGAKRVKRVSKRDGHEYIFREGTMSPHDDLDKPSRTMMTSEGRTNRSTHLLKVGSRYRLLTPIEAERLQEFPDDWTKYRVTKGKLVENRKAKRMFFMGNALVTGVITTIAKTLETNIRN